MNHHNSPLLDVRRTSPWIIALGCICVIGAITALTLRVSRSMTQARAARLLAAETCDRGGFHRYGLWQTVELTFEYRQERSCTNCGWTVTKLLP